MSTRVSGRRRGLFIAELARSGNVAAAARMAKLARGTVYSLRQGDPEFRRRWDEALEEAVDLLEAEARARAVDGVDQPHFHQGRITGTVRKYSDALLMFLLKAHRPEKYRERAEREREEETLEQEIAAARLRLEGRLDRLAGGDGTPEVPGEPE